MFLFFFKAKPPTIDANPTNNAKYLGYLLPVSGRGLFVLLELGFVKFVSISSSTSVVGISSEGALFISSSISGVSVPSLSSSPVPGLVLSSSVSGVSVTVLSTIFQT